MFLTFDSTFFSQCVNSRISCKIRASVWFVDLKQMFVISYLCLVLSNQIINQAERNQPKPYNFGQAYNYKEEQKFNQLFQCLQFDITWPGASSFDWSVPGMSVKHKFFFVTLEALTT